jgi:Protein of unknown function (DUF1580)
MIDSALEHVFPIAETRDHVASHPSLASIYRWAFKGVRGVQLETILIGGRRYTSREAVARFIARLSEPRAVETTTQTKLRAEQIVRAARKAAATF